MCLHAQACHLIQTISSRLWVLDKALQEHEPEYPGVHGLQEDGEKALSGAVRESAGTGGSREANPRDLGAEDRSLESWHTANPAPLPQQQQHALPKALQ